MDCRFKKGHTPHNKKWHGNCIVKGCFREDIKALGLCNRHYKVKQYRERNGILNSDLSERLPRTKEHIERFKKSYPETHSLKGKTYEEIYGVEKAKKRREKMRRPNFKLRGRTSPLKGRKTGKPAWNKGKTHCALDKNGAWKGGVSFFPYPKEFNKKLKEKIRERDGRKCVECGAPEKDFRYKLSVHHIDEDKNNNKENNLISLCKKCHSKVHWEKKDWIKYFSEIISQQEVLK